MKTNFLLFIFAVFAAHAQPGALDVSFSGDGKLTASLTTGNNTANAVAVQSDFKILAAGAVFNGTSSTDFGVARYNEDGTPDLTFNGTGASLADFNHAFDYCTGMALQPDGKIVLGGYTDFGAGFDFALARFNANGTPDGTFGADGKVTLHFGTTAFANAIALQPDGKILMTGYVMGESANLLVVVRFLSDGSLDLDFGTGGKSIVPIGEDSAIAHAIAVQPNDGKIVVAGRVMNGALLRWEALLFRFDADGAPDTGFGTQGQVITRVANQDYVVTAVALSPDGKIATAGYTGNSPSAYKATLARYLSDGTPDNEFADNGIGIVPLGSSGDQPKSIVLLENRIVVGGSVQQNGLSRFVVASFDQNGAPVASFGDNGSTTTAFAQQDGINAMALAPDGKIVAAGVSFSTTVSVFAMTRYHTEASLSVAEIPTKNYGLSVYPNPIDGSSQLAFRLTQTEKIAVVLYDALGRKVRDVIGPQTKMAGTHQVALALGDLQPGVYYAVFSTPDSTQTLRLLK